LEDKMTIKEIAELCQVKRDTIELWAHKVIDDPELDFPGLAEKLEKGSPKAPSDYTLDETIAIIGQGGGNKTLAKLLVENAESKEALEIGHRVTRHYAKIVGPASKKADKVYDLMEKYKYSDKVSKEDTRKLFECATALRRYFYDTAMVNDTLVIHNWALEDRLARVCHRFGISQKEVPAGFSWDKKAWPDFPELLALKSAPLPALPEPPDPNNVGSVA
jgi:hypothetical protein